jgi:hypothetical protein
VQVPQLKHASKSFAPYFFISLANPVSIVAIIMNI